MSADTSSETPWPQRLGARINGILFEQGIATTVYYSRPVDAKDVARAVVEITVASDAPKNISLKTNLPPKEPGDLDAVAALIAYDFVQYRQRTLGGET